MDLSGWNFSGSGRTVPKVASTTGEAQSQSGSTQAEATLESDDRIVIGDDEDEDVILVHPRASPLKESRRASDNVLSRSTEGAGKRVESVCRRLSLLRDSQTVIIYVATGINFGGVSLEGVVCKCYLDTIAEKLL